jgi:hypothetical protein
VSRRTAVLMKWGRTGITNIFEKKETRRDINGEALYIIFRTN